MLSLKSLNEGGGTEIVAQRCSVKTVFLEILQNPQEKTYARDSFLIKLQALALACNFIRPGTLLKKNFWHRCFPVNCEISKNTFFLQYTSGGCFRLAFNWGRGLFPGDLHILVPLLR